MTANAGKNALSSSAFIAYLSLIADSKWVSRRAFTLWDMTPNWRSAVIRKMQDDGLITCTNLNEKIVVKKRINRKKRKEEGAESVEEIEEEVPPYIYGVRYSLTMKGREYLAAYNPRKYGRVGDMALAAKDYNIRKVYRQSLLSEMRAMSELAGYSVHPHAKPFVSILSSLPLSLADRPAFIAFTASEIPERFKSFENSYFNQNFFQYYTQSTKRKPYGYEHYDAKRYSYRETPVGCVYTLPELLALAEEEAKERGGNKEETDRLRYTRLSGVLFTGHGSYRLYNTERTAPRLRVNGERNMKILLDIWTANIYKQSLSVMRDNGKGEAELAPVIPEVKGSVLFGDASHHAAVSVIKNTFLEEFGKVREKERVIRNYNLRIIPNTYFIPVIAEAVPLYSIMLYPHWPVWGVKIGKDYLGTLYAERSEAPALAREYIGEVFPHGEMSDGSFLAVMTPLHLDAVRSMLLNLSGQDARYTIVAMEWQKPFFDGLLEEMNPDDIHKLKFIYMPQNYLAGYVKNLHEHHGNTYYAKLKEER